MSEKSVGDLLFEKGPLGDLARKGAEELGGTGGVSEMVEIKFHKFRGSMATGKPMCARLLPGDPENMCILEIGHDDDAHEGEILLWSVRIPAAIKKAEELTEGGLIVICERDQHLTAGEATLAEGYWARYCTAVLDSPVGTPDEEVPPELIKFCEKVEKLT